MGWKYKTEAERIAAEKAYQAAYRALRKSGKWVRKNRIHSPQIAAKCGATIEPPPVAPVKPVGPSKRRARSKTSKERAAAMKAYQAAYRALRKSGKWVRKTNIHSPRIAAKYGLTIGPTQPSEPKVAAPTSEPPKPTVRIVTPEERKAREKEKQRKYWHDHYSAIIRERRLAAMTPEQRAARDRRLAAQEGRTLPGVIREVILRLALECGVSADVMTEKLLMVGGVDFLMRGIEPRMEKRTYNRDVLIRTALEGARFVLDRDHAVIAWTRQDRPPHKRENVV